VTILAFTYDIKASLIIFLEFFKIYLPNNKSILVKVANIETVLLPTVWPSTTLYLNNKGKIKKSILKDFVKMQIEVTFTLKSFL
jgi:hypothetical protein